MKQPTHYEAMRDVIERIRKNKLHSESLEELAAELKLSPGHLQKVFTNWVGITPKQFSRYLSLQYSKELLKENAGTTQATVKAGLSSPGRLYDLFVDIEGVTPGEFQKRGESVTIHYSTFDTQFGLCLVASSKYGICSILFADSEKEALQDLNSRWPHASLVSHVEKSHREIEKYFKGITPDSKIKLHLRGTNFQVKVWEALLSIPEGMIASYGDIAEGMGDKNLSRAVGAAVGQNPIGYLIPCHRVLKSTGEMSGYHWGVERKRAMLGYEAVRRSEM